MENQVTKDAFGLKEIIGTLALFGAMSEFAVMNPCIAAFAQHFAGTPMTTIMFANTICGAVAVPVAIIVGAVLPKVGYKPAALFGCILMAVGGAFPFLMPDMTNYGQVVFSRITVGIGLGIVTPIGPATVFAFTEGKQRAKLLGWGSSVTFVFTMILSIAAGILCEIAWNWSFLAYLIVLVPFVFALFCLPEAKHIVRAERAAEKARETTTAQKASVPKAIWGYAVLAVCAFMLVATIQMQGSNIFLERNLGGSGIYGVIMNACGLGSIVAGIIYGSFVRVLKKRIYVVSAILGAIGFVPCFLVSSVPLYALGLFLIGFGGSMFYTTAQNAASNITPVSRTSFVSGVMTSMMNLSTLIGPYFITLAAMLLPTFGATSMCPLAIVFFVVLGVVSLILPLKGITMTSAQAEETK